VLTAVVKYAIILNNGVLSLDLSEHRPELEIVHATSSDAQSLRELLWYER
jgi:hypothetical protein